MADDEMVGWHHRLGGHEFEQALGESGGQGSLEYCIHGVSEQATTEQLNNTVVRQPCLLLAFF